MKIYSDPMTENIRSIIALGNDRLLAGHTDGEISLWQLTLIGDIYYKFQHTYSFCGHKDSIHHLVLLPQNRFISLSRDKTMRIWNMTTGVCEKILHGKSVAFSSCDSVVTLPDELIVVSGSADEGFQCFDVWDLRTEKCLFEQQECLYKDHISLALTNEGYLAVHGYFSAELSVWDVNRISCVKLSAYREENIHAMVASPTGEIVTAGFNVNIFELGKEGKIKSGKVMDNSNMIEAIIPLDDYRVLTVDRQGYCSGRLKIWNYALNTTEVLGNSRTPTGQVADSHIVFIKSGHVVSLSEGQFCIQYFPEIAQIRKGFAEIRKNARLLAQSYRTGTGFFASLPIEVNVKIAALTGKLQAYDNTEKIALDHFSKPFATL